VNSRPGSLAADGFNFYHKLRSLKQEEPLMPKNNASIFSINYNNPWNCRKGGEILQGLRTEKLKIRSASDAVHSAIFCIFSKFCFYQLSLILVYLN